ncbi:MAG TPA: glycosyltransferase, partial [Ferruginibacter sp.]|nr:glycosyltransferase [Ferruginibacter sp.]
EAAIPFKTRFVGFLKDEYSVSLVYNAANVFVVPSLADNLPTTVLESLSCGTPVVGFDVGGIPDMISHRENGYLARYKSAEDLAEGIRFCIKNQVKGRILANFEKDSVMKRHLDLMETIETGK